MVLNKFALKDRSERGRGDMMALCATDFRLPFFCRSFDRLFATSLLSFVLLLSIEFYLFDVTIFRVLLVSVWPNSSGKNKLFALGMTVGRQCERERGGKCYLLLLLAKLSIALITTINAHFIAIKVRHRHCRQSTVSVPLMRRNTSALRAFCEIFAFDK